MNRGSTEMYLALQRALRERLRITIHIAQSPSMYGQVIAVTNTYADIQCEVPPDSQLELVRLVFPFLEGSFRISAAARAAGQGLLRVDIESTDDRAIATSASTARPGSLLDSVRTDLPPAFSGGRLPVQRTHPLLYYIRSLMPAKSEHRVTIFPYAKPTRNADPAVIYLNTAAHPLIADFCLPVEPPPKPLTFDLRVDIGLDGLLCGRIDVINLPQHGLGEWFTKLSVCAVAAAHTLLVPETPDSVFQLKNRSRGALLFAGYRAVDSDQINTDETGIVLSMPHGWYFTVPRNPA